MRYRINRKPANWPSFIEVTSVTEYDKLFYKNISIDAQTHKRLYRGSRKEYKTLIPSVFRERTLLESTTAIPRVATPWNEKRIYSALSDQQPFELRGTAFDKLCLCQHYGLPTRLLDFTSDRYVALYFACANHSTNDTGNTQPPSSGEPGIVYAIAAKEVRSSQDIVKYISSLSGFFDSEATDQWTATYLCDYLSDRFPTITIGDFQKMLDSTWLAVNISRHNARSYAQKGRFILFGFEIFWDVASAQRTGSHPGTREGAKDALRMLLQDISNDKRTDDTDEIPLKELASVLRDITPTTEKRTKLICIDNYKSLEGVEEYFELEQNAASKTKSLAICRIPDKNKGYILSELENLGYNEKSVYPPTLEERIREVLASYTGDE
jgi:hypothetical protein